jgi:(p)ppGpp synthase/HD superfamily hydrolase
MKEDYAKMKIAIRYWLIGRKYYNAVKALDFAESYHTGIRKDGQPEFSHQISQANYCRVFDELLDFPEETFCVIFLHDILEDYDVTYEQLLELFGVVVADATLKMSKIRNGVKIPNDIYYVEMLTCPIASLAKGVDRLHNLFTMVGGFTSEKQISYINETLEYVVPLLKKARRNFHKQEGVFHNIKYIITVHVTLYGKLNESLT